MSRPTTSDATESRESAEESGRMELSENIKRLRFMQAKKSTAGRSQQPVKQNPQKFFYQQQLQMLRQQQKHHQELRLSNKGKTNERSPSLPQQSEALQLRQLHELRRHWCAPGWECAEAMYAMQEEEDTKTQRRFAVHQSAGSKNKQAGHICRTMTVARAPEGGCREAAVVPKLTAKRGQKCDVGPRRDVLMAA
ncbi:hypothetical protein CSUI_001613 [Cystoisospora suis]|uniref:Uncharacterized protein n=1 Tax=Cystoisospora suis TaxID=483139 RepID=A0A2C6LB36_9APIC|nr:hypothetical protein CSUI_001613 [Cystoisospora suis]